MILSTLEKRQSFGELDDFWYRPVWSFGGGGKDATPEQALGLSAWFNGIAIIAGTLGSLPCKLYRRDGEAREPVTDDPRHWLAFRQPNPWQTAFEWREMAQGHLLARGNHYSRIIRDRLDRARAFVPLHPDRVEVLVRDSEIIYRVRSSAGTEDLPAREVFHMRGIGGNGLTGYSVVALARRGLGYALGLEEHGSELMGNKARPGGVLQTGQILKSETRNALAKQWDEMYTGGGIGKTAVLDAGLSWTQVGFSMEDAQFIESRKFQVTEVARWLNLPPHFLKDLERSTFSNIEHQSLEYVIHTIRPWAERWEQRLDMALLDESEREELFFKFNLEALLRGDSVTRAAFYNALFQMGALSPNEIRALEDMNPTEGGDQRFVQLNLVPLDRAGDPMGAMDDGLERALELPASRDPMALARDQEWQRAATSAMWEQRAQRSARLRRRLMQTHRALFTEASGRLVRREVADLRRLLDAVDDGDVVEFFRRLDIFSEGLPETVRSVMGPLVVAYIDLVSDAAAEEIGMEELPEDRLTAWRSAYVDTLARGHTTETVGKLRDTMTEAEGDPFDNARAMLDRWEDNRPATMGLREAVTAGGGVAVTVYNLGGFGARWRTVGKSCPYCSMLDGRTVESGQRFLEAGDTLDPDDGENEPLTVGRSVGHPQAHTGCDCYVSAWRP